VVLSASPTFTGVPLSTTAANATNTTQIATTAFAYGTLSAATNGYTKLANGLVMQWGIVNGVAPGGATGATFPIAFPTACTFVVNQAAANNSGGNSTNIISSKSTTAFVGLNFTGVTTSFNYFAIGY
jgi:hypothetical protein